jgi:HEAT repeat protein
VWWRISLIVLACAPSLTVIWRAHAGIRPTTKQVLAQVVSNPDVLVNVGAADMPASPDILELGRRSTPALGRCLADNPDAGLRAACGDMIGVLGDPSAIAALHIALEDWDDSVRLHAVRSLGRIADARSAAPLVAAWQRGDETRENRLAILRALGSIASPPALAFLRHVMRAPIREHEDDLRPVAFSELWRNRRNAGTTAVDGDLEFALRSDNPRMVHAGALRAAAQRSARLAPALLAHVDDANANTRNKVIRALGLIGDRRATSALLARIGRARDARLLNNLAFALERIDRRAFFTQIDRLITHKQAVIRLNAAFVVGDVHRPEGARLLARALADPSDRVRREATVAAAKLPSPAPLLAQALADRDVEVRALATEAAGELGDAALLTRALADPELSVRLAAVRGARSLKAPATFLTAATKDGEERVRAAAVEVAIQHPAAPLALIAAAVADPSPLVSRPAVDGVTRHKIAAALPALRKMIDDPQAPLREEAIYATDAATRDGRADLVYDLLFVHGDSAQRQRAALLLAARSDARVHDYLVECLLGQRCTTEAALPLLRDEKEPSVVRRLQLAWVRGRADLAPLLIALRPPGTAPLALAGLEAVPAGDRAGVLGSASLLVDLGEPAARPLLIARRAEGDLGQRMRLDAALDLLGAPDARQRLVTTLDDAPLEWLPEVAEVLTQLDHPAQRRALEAEIAKREASSEYQRALAAAAVRLGWQEAEAPERLLRALDSARPRERELARRYLRAAPSETLERAKARERRPRVREELERLAGSSG